MTRDKRPNLYAAGAFSHSWFRHALPLWHDEPRTMNLPIQPSNAPAVSTAVREEGTRESKRLPAASYAASAYRPELRNVHYETKATQERIHILTRLVGPGQRVLDLGCYDGTIGAMLLKNRNEVFGLEINPEAAVVARERGLRVCTHSFEESFPFPDAFFNVVLAAEAIEHIADTDFFLSEVRRVLTPRGCLVLSTPNSASLGRRLLLLFGGNPFFEASFSFPQGFRAGHLRYFTKGLLLGFLTHMGFETERVTSDAVNFPGGLSSVLLAKCFPTFGGTLIVKARKR